MANVVPRLNSIQYDGSNVEALQQIVFVSDYWQRGTSTVTPDYAEWVGPEGNRIRVPVGGYLVYNEGSTTLVGLSQEDYQTQYRETA